MSRIILELEHVSKHFKLGGIKNIGKKVHAMDDVCFSLAAGESLALVGESGSGKTTTASVVAGLYEKTSGEIVFDGNPLRPFKNRGEALAYKKRVQMAFQDPFASLNPTHTIRAILERPFLIHGLASGKAELEEKLVASLEQVGLSPAREYLRRFPHELSGGQRQRVNIARTFAVEPEIVLADEPTSMLDVSIRLGIMNMMLDLKEKKGVSYLYITHDLAGARYMSSRIAVMYAGMIMEIGPTEEVISNAIHPYVRLLKASAPSPKGERGDETLQVKGEIPSLVAPPSGCRFRTRCPFASPACASEIPALRDIGGGHLVRCVLA
ncbi:MAG TPA: ABC transporter ATP-binding protein [Rectinemataceae bacterium]|nr:ABC transporter ATP-binding protein [Rectinemataceae bacterium]